MAIQLTFDPQEVLQPFEGDVPSGQDPRGDTSANAPFLRMKDARATARRKERALDVDPDAPLPSDDWHEVGEAAIEVLSQTGKDLEVAAWMIEALVRIDGFSGLCTGLAVAQGLVNDFWESVYPLPDEDGNEPRLGPFIALNGVNNDGTLIQPLRKIPLTASGSEPFSFWQYEQALEISQISDSAKREGRISSGGIKLEDFEAAVQATPAGFYLALVEQIEASLKALSDLSDAFSARVGVDAPPGGAIRSVLNAVLDGVRLFAAGKLEQASAQSEMQQAHAESAAMAAEGGEDVAGAGDAGEGGALPAGRPRSRTQALQQLLTIAAYFRETEPHSPLSYTLEEAVRRSRMPLTDLLEELIIDSDARRYFYLAAGLRAPASEG